MGQKSETLDRPQLYVRILQKVKMKPAAKSPLQQAYFTTDHLRAIYQMLELVGEAKCPSRKTH